MASSSIAGFGCVGEGAGLEIIVVFTSVEATVAAVPTAARLTRALHARIIAQTAPFPAPLNSPLVLLDWNERRLRAIVEASPIETSVRIYLCRNRVETLKRMLRPHSFVVLNHRKRRWWPTMEEKLARELRRAGHDVLLTERAHA
jgi:hypothetical protein